MDTIRTYVENLFSGLPRTQQVLKLKDDLLSTMEDKYTQLKSEGKTENEAVGIVISEFGNIDELIAELGIEKGSSDDSALYMSDDDVEQYLALNKKSFRSIAIGVALCILAPASLIFFGDLLETRFGVSSSLGLLPMFVLIAIAVVLFIVNGVSLDRYEDVEKKQVIMDTACTQRVRDMLTAYTPTFAGLIATGVALCILAVLIPIFLTGILIDGAAVALMLAVIAVAVFLFVIAGGRHSAYEKLLGIGEHKKKATTRADKLFDTIMGLVWPLTVIAFLVWGFKFDGWAISWCLFPIVGILSGFIKGLCNLSANDDK